MDSPDEDLTTLQEAADAPSDSSAAARGGVSKRSGFAILAIFAACGLNLAGLAVVTAAVTSTRDQLERRMAELSTPDAESETAPRVEISTRDDVGDLLDIAERLATTGDAEGARRLRARAQELLLQREGEDGAYTFALQLLQQGRTREARRAFYRILARADQPGTRWGELAARARFRIGAALAKEADRVDAPEEGGQ